MSNYNQLFGIIPNIQGKGHNFPGIEHFVVLKENLMSHFQWYPELKTKMLFFFSDLLSQSTQKRNQVVFCIPS